MHTYLKIILYNFLIIQRLLTFILTTSYSSLQFFISLYSCLYLLMSYNFLQFLTLFCHKLYYTPWGTRARYTLFWSTLSKRQYMYHFMDVSIGVEFVWSSKTDIVYSKGLGFDSTKVPTSFFNFSILTFLVFYWQHFIQL